MNGQSHECGNVLVYATDSKGRRNIRSLIYCHRGARAAIHALQQLQLPPLPHSEEINIWTVMSARVTQAPSSLPRRRDGWLAGASCLAQGGFNRAALCRMT